MCTAYYAYYALPTLSLSRLVTEVVFKQISLTGQWKEPFLTNQLDACNKLLFFPSKQNCFQKKKKPSRCETKFPKQQYSIIFHEKKKKIKQKTLSFINI